MNSTSYNMSNMGSSLLGGVDVRNTKSVMNQIDTDLISNSKIVKG